MAGPGGSSRSPPPGGVGRGSSLSLRPDTAPGGSSVSLLPGAVQGVSSVSLAGAVCDNSFASLPDTTPESSSASLPDATPERSCASLLGAVPDGSSAPRPDAVPDGSPAPLPGAAPVPMALYEEVSVAGFEEFNRAVEQHQDKTIFAYFSGSKDAEGKSWCPDCVLAEPVVREGLKHISEACVFIYCQVGERTYWKDPNNDFRQKLKLTAVPTLLKYGTPQKLVESECLQATLVEMLFSED